VVALAGAEGAGAIAGLVLGVKWPNDLLGPDGRKVAGVLAEGDLASGGAGPGTSPAGPPAVVVGIGINVNWPAEDGDLPEDLVGTATSLRQQAGHPVDRWEVLDALLTALEPRLSDLGTVAGRARQAQDLRRRCTTLGTKVRVELADSGFEGIAVDLTAEGHLVVDAGGQLRTVVAGDVVHVRPST
jgi:BirA family biotin operon repressor/biotin-[acetyl-CoA-carboxylase] ligase